MCSRLFSAVSTALKGTHYYIFICIGAPGKCGSVAVCIEESSGDEGLI